MTFKHLVLITMLISISVGCAHENKGMENEKAVNYSLENPEFLSQKPPQMKIELDGEQFSAVLSGYEWSYFDPDENTIATVQTESLSPSELLGNRSAPDVSSETVIQFIFDDEPLSYRVNSWDAQNKLMTSSDAVVLDGQTGRTIYEVAATWEQGRAHYFFPFTIK